MTTGRALSPRDAEKTLGIPAATVRSWWHRRDRTGLTPVDHDRNGNPLFRRTDLITLRDRRKRLTGPRDNTTRTDLGRLLSAAEAERHLGIPAGTVRAWHHRHTRGLHEAGIGPDQRPVFYEADLITVARGETVFDSDGQRRHHMTDHTRTGPDG